MDARSSRSLRPVLAMWKIWLAVLVLFAIAFAVAWALVKGSVRRAEERHAVPAATPR
jgi:hypothetical protein